MASNGSGSNGKTSGTSSSSAASDGSGSTTAADKSGGTDSSLGTAGDELNAAKTSHGVFFWLTWVLLAAIAGGLIAWATARFRRRHHDRMLRRRMNALARELHAEQDRNKERTLDLADVR